MADDLDWRQDLTDPRLASVFDEMSFWTSRFGRLLFEQLELRRDQRILDVGCGTGFPLLELAGAHGPTARVVGVDVWMHALRRAATKIATHGSTNVEVVAADGAALPFPDETFDLIVSNVGLNNFERPQQAMAECARVARPGARLALTTNLTGHMGELYARLREVLAELGLERYDERVAAEEAHRGTRDSVRELMESSGFEAARFVDDAFEMRYLDGTALLSHPLTRMGFLEGWRGAVDAEHRDAVFAALEAKLNDVAGRQGGLRMKVPMLYAEGRRRTT